ncbi:hypothetical protein LTR74_018002 [Friedmanniomyces endolithicus]|nr:hypothetical protein LTR74_018002 [Friedmanniomyces endolithicus]
MYLRAREKAFTTTNIESGWETTGTVLSKIQVTPTPQALPPSTPRQTNGLDLSLLHTSPPDGTELRIACAVLQAELQKASSLPSPVKRDSERMTRALEKTQSELVTLQREIAKQHELLQTRKARKKGKRVASKGKFVFSTQEVLEITKAAAEETTAKKGRKRRRAPSIDREVGI